MIADAANSKINKAFLAPLFFNCVNCTLGTALTV